MPALNVQGSNLYFIDPEGDSNGGTIVEVGCVTTIDGIDASRAQNDVTCISDETRRLEAGLLEPGAATFSINFDTTDESHARLHELYRAGTTLQWALGFSDGTSLGLPVPTGIDTDGGFIFPTTRSFLEFEGYLTSFPWNLAIGAKVTNSIGIQVSNFPVLHIKT